MAIEKVITSFQRVKQDDGTYAIILPITSTENVYIDIAEGKTLGDFLENEGRPTTINTVPTEEDRFKLTSASVKLMDIVKVTETNKLYFIVDLENLDNEAGYEAISSVDADTTMMRDNNRNGVTTITDAYAVKDITPPSADKQLLIQLPTTAFSGNEIDMELTLNCDNSTKFTYRTDTNIKLAEILQKKDNKNDIIGDISPDCRFVFVSEDVNSKPEEWEHCNYKLYRNSGTKFTEIPFEIIFPPTAIDKRIKKVKFSKSSEIFIIVIENHIIYYNIRLDRFDYLGYKVINHIHDLDFLNNDDIITTYDILIPWTTKTTPVGDFGSVCYGNGIYVAVGYVSKISTSVIMTSIDGITWTPRTVPPGTRQLVSVCVGNGLFVAVSSGYNPDITDSVLTSPDGITWTPRTNTPHNSWKTVCFGNGLFVAVGGSASIPAMSSPDGIDWTPITNPILTYITHIVYGDGKFVGVGMYGAVVLSTDGVNWTSANALPDSEKLKSICYGNGLFVVCVPDDKKNPFRTSPDGITWTKQIATGSGYETVCYGAGRFVAIYDYGIATSNDGKIWNARVNPPTNIRWRGVCYGANGVYIGVGWSGNNATEVLYGQDVGHKMTYLQKTNISNIINYSNPELLTQILPGMPYSIIISPVKNIIGLSMNTGDSMLMYLFNSASSVLPILPNTGYVAPTKKILMFNFNEKGTRCVIGDDGWYSLYSIDTTTLKYNVTHNLTAGTGNYFYRAGAFSYNDDSVMVVNGGVHSDINSISGLQSYQLRPDGTVVAVYGKSAHRYYFSNGRGIKYPKHGENVIAISNTIPYIHTISLRMPLLEPTTPANNVAHDGDLKAMSPNGKYYVEAYKHPTFDRIRTFEIQQDDSFRLLDTNMGTFPQIANFTAVAFSPDSDLFILASATYNVVTERFLSLFVREGNRFTYKTVIPITRTTNNSLRPLSSITISETFKLNVDGDSVKYIAVSSQLDPKLEIYELNMRTYAMSKLPREVDFGLSMVAQPMDMMFIQLYSNKAPMLLYTLVVPVPVGEPAITVMEHDSDKNGYVYKLSLPTSAYNGFLSISKKLPYENNIRFIASSFTHGLNGCDIYKVDNRGSITKVQSIVGKNAYYEFNNNVTFLHGADMNKIYTFVRRGESFVDQMEYTQDYPTTYPITDIVSTQIVETNRLIINTLRYPFVHIYKLDPYIISDKIRITASDNATTSWDGALAYLDHPDVFDIKLCVLDDMKNAVLIKPNPPYIFANLGINIDKVNFYGERVADVDYVQDFKAYLDSAENIDNLIMEESITDVIKYKPEIDTNFKNPITVGGRKVPTITKIPSFIIKQSSWAADIVNTGFYTRIHNPLISNSSIVNIEIQGLKSLNIANSALVRSYCYEGDGYVDLFANSVPTDVIAVDIIIFN